MKQFEEQLQAEEADISRVVADAKKVLKTQSKNELIREFIGLMLGYQTLKIMFEKLEQENNELKAKGDK